VQGLYQTIASHSSLSLTLTVIAPPPCSLSSKIQKDKGRSHFVETCLYIHFPCDGSLNRIGTEDLQIIGPAPHQPSI
jgi:hypothetical protein